MNTTVPTRWRADGGDWTIGVNACDQHGIPRGLGGGVRWLRRGFEAWAHAYAKEKTKKFRTEEKAKRWVEKTMRALTRV